MGKKRPAQKSTPVKSAKKQKVEKIAEQSDNENQVAKKKAPKGKASKVTEINPFSQNFHAMLNDFQTLYQDYLAFRAKVSDINAQSELKSTTDRVSEEIQREASAIFKRQLQNLEEWIQEEIKKINGEIDTIERVYEDNRESLLKTGAFSQEELKGQLAPIQAKATAKKQIREKYQGLLAKASEIYN